MTVRTACAKSENVSALGGLKASNLNRISHAGQRSTATGRCPSVYQQRRQHFTRREYLTRFGKVAKPRRQVDRLANVVIAFEQDHVALSDPGAQLEHLFVGVDHRNNGFDHRLWFNSNDHCTITEPLGDAHSMNRGQSPDASTDHLEHLDSRGISLSIGERSKAGHVDEREGPVNSCYPAYADDVAHNQPR